MSGSRRWAAASALAAAVASAVGQPLLLTATTREPRAFGYHVGDVVSRTVMIHAPDGLVLDEASVPQPGARGKSLELRDVARRSDARSRGRSIELTLDYQVFLAPPHTRTLEMPSFTLRFQGMPRAQELRVDAWPLTVSPLAPVDVSARRGLGELQPDTPPPLIDTAPARNRLVVYAGVLLSLLGYLGHVYLGLPWWSRAHRPFAQAWRSLRSLTPASSEMQCREAFQRVHQALNRTAGEVVFEQGIDRFVVAQPRFECLRDDLVNFFRQSRHVFFARRVPGDADRIWLIEFCRRCRDAERGAA